MIYFLSIFLALQLIVAPASAQQASAQQASAQQAPAQETAASTGPDAAVPDSGLWIAPLRAEGPYFSVMAGANYRFTSVDKNEAQGLETKWGPVLLLAGGWSFGSGLRLEAELGRRTMDVDRIAAARVAGRRLWLEDPGGQVSTSSAMVNLAAESQLLGVHVYAGLGIGIARQDVDGVTGRGAVRRVPVQLHAEGGQTQLAGQVFAGLGLPLDRLGLRDTMVMAEYRAFATAGKTSVPWQVTLADGRVAASGRSRFDNHNQAILVGIRHSFSTGADNPAVTGGAPPPPAAAP